LKDNPQLEAMLELTEDSVLGCWCKPEACHCDVIAAAWYWLNTKLDELATKA
jgi:hypothetical protein